MHVPDPAEADGADVAVAANKLYANHSPDLYRSVSAVDSGYNDRDLDDYDYDGASSVCSDACSSMVSEAKDLVHRAHDQAATVAFEGNINVENSTQVQFGNNTHYHGPVTVLLNATKVVTNAAPPSYDAAALPAVGQDAPLPGKQPETPSGPAAPAPAADAVPAKSDGPQGPEAEAPLARWRLLALGAAAATLMVVVIAVLAVLLPGTASSDDNRLGPDRLPNGLTMVPRHEWLAQPPKPGVDPLTTPVEYVILHHSATDPCYSFPECVLRIRYIQTFHVESKNWSDIAYNFMVGGDGYVYVGRGWDKAGAHTLNWNHRSIGICLVGTFSYQQPTPEQLRAVGKLIEYGVQLGNVVAEYKLAAVCQFRSSESPGKFVRDEMKKWDHYWNYTVGDSYCK